MREIIIEANTYKTYEDFKTKVINTKDIRPFLEDFIKFDSIIFQLDGVVDTPSGGYCAKYSQGSG